MPHGNTTPLEGLTAIRASGHARTLLRARPAHTVGIRQRSDAWQRTGVDRMATFRAYAKVLEPDDPTMRIYEAGLRACPGEPGMPLAEVLRRSGGVYQTTTPLLWQLAAGDNDPGQPVTGTVVTAICT